MCYKQVVRCCHARGLLDEHTVLSAKSCHTLAYRKISNTSIVHDQGPVMDFVQVGRMRILANQMSARLNLHKGDHTTDSSKRNRILQRSVPPVVVNGSIETSNRPKGRTHRSRDNTKGLVRTHIRFESVLLAWVAKVAATDDVEVMANFQPSSDRDFKAKPFTAQYLHNIEFTRSYSC